MTTEQRIAELQEALNKINAVIEDMAGQVTPAPEPTDKPLIIFDTDFAEDVDDAGAVAVLHALAAKGELNILGMMISIPTEWGAPGLDALNTFYGKPEIPIGIVTHNYLTAAHHISYNKVLAEKFPNSLKHSRNAPKAIDLYTELLTKAADKSVTIVTVGPLVNLYDLMQSQGGMELIQQKVNRLVMAGGRLPFGTSYNFKINPAQSEYVINNWPTEIWSVPNDLGDDVLTGSEVIITLPQSHPIYAAYAAYKAFRPNWPFRPSWDQIGVYIAARPGDSLFNTVEGSVYAEKENIKWVDDGGFDVWFQSNSTTEQRREIIEDLMMYQP